MLVQRFRNARRLVTFLVAAVAVIAMPAMTSSGPSGRSFTAEGGEPRARSYAGTSLSEFEAFERQVLDHVDQYWRDVFAAARAGAGYQSPSAVLTPRGELRRSACGYSADPADYPRLDASPAFYCAADQTLYLSTSWLYREVYEAYGDFAVAVVLAHEVAHHVQYVVGVVDERGAVCCDKSGPQLELEADCLAGTWANAADQDGLLEAGDLEEAMAGSYAAGDASRTSHGTPSERRDWFEHGFKTGKPNQCQPPR